MCHLALCHAARVDLDGWEGRAVRMEGAGELGEHRGELSHNMSLVMDVFGRTNTGLWCRSSLPCADLPTLGAGFTYEAWSDYLASPVRALVKLSRSLTKPNLSAKAILFIYLASQLRNSRLCTC